MDDKALHLRKVVGWAIRQRRRGPDHGWKLKDLAAASKISLGYLSQVELGVNSPSLETLVRICRALGVDIEFLFSRATREAYAANVEAVGVYVASVVS